MAGSPEAGYDPTAAAAAPYSFVVAETAALRRVLEAELAEMAPFLLRTTAANAAASAAAATASDGSPAGSSGEAPFPAAGVAAFDERLFFAAACALRLGARVLPLRVPSVASPRLDVNPHSELYRAWGERMRPRLSSADLSLRRPPAAIAASAAAPPPPLSLSSTPASSAPPPSAPASIPRRGSTSPPCGTPRGAALPACMAWI